MMRGAARSALLLLIALLLLGRCAIATEAHADPARPSMPELFADGPKRLDPRMTGTTIPYRGRYYVPSQLIYAQCVHARESSNHWYSTSTLYEGGFQFSHALAEGATWMITPELKSLYGPRLGREIAAELRATGMARWLPEFQSMAFFTVLNWDGTASGAGHWAGGRWHCTPGMGRAR